MSVTLVIHGTFAKNETWWRLEPDRASFANKLEAALARRGMTGTVWQPAVAAGLTYADFSWSHENDHRARRRGGRTLAATLQRLAEAQKATAEAPLDVNLVAHSHGGNVVLEALRHLDPAVRVRRIVLLGTPLIAARPGMRILRIAMAAALLSLIGAVSLAIVLLLFGVIPTSQGMSVGKVAAPLLPMIAFYGWILVFAAWLVDRLFAVITWPFRRLRRRTAGQVYGPPPDTVRRMVTNGQIVLFTTHDDEADLALQFSAAPRRLYREFVRHKLAKAFFLVRWLEFLVMRPVVLGMILGVVEAILERFVLGFPWLRVLFVDYEMADLKKGKAYPAWLLQREDVSDQLLPSIRRSSAALQFTPPPVPAAPPEVQQAGRRVTGLYEKLALVVQNFKAQLQLRHSVYYEADTVIERVAAAVADKP